MILVHLTIVWFDKSFPAEGEAKGEINSSSFVVIVPRCWSDLERRSRSVFDSEKKLAALLFS